MGSTMKGATAPPMEEPVSKKAVASARSRLGNHSETALVAAGQFADSPAPRKNRKPAKLKKPLANDVSIEMIEYQITVRVRPRRVPMRSMSRPNTLCPMEYAMRKAMAM